MLYELLVREYEIAKIEEAKSMPTIQVLDQAAVPELPMPRGTIKKAMVAGITAAVFGLFLAFILEYCRETKQAGLAKQFERATRWRKARRPYSGESGNNGQEEAAVREAAGADI
jgi:tyrosine-protein kinase Etk/Wzc